jgi:hypothetical protein
VKRRLFVTRFYSKQKSGVAIDTKNDPFDVGQLNSFNAKAYKNTTNYLLSD